MQATLHTLPNESALSGANDDAAADPVELAAVKAALGGDLVARIKLGSRALRKILADPEDTKQVFVLFLSLNAKHIPRFLTRFISEDNGLALMTARSSLDSRTVDYEALGRLPADTLGGAFARHLSDRGLSTDIFKAPPGVPAPIAYMAQRLRQCHDIWHVLAGYDTTVDDELALLAFSYGQSQMPGPAVLAVVGALRFTPKFPKAIPKVWEGFQRGKAARSLITVRWEDMWATPLAEVRERYGIRPRKV